ncbi:MAG: alkylphosphonate ABC transporter [Pseudohongiella sp.]|nr:MAG: alkylphosphonate ABC transporter [Pseudohongiella sp.]
MKLRPIFCLLLLLVCSPWTNAVLAAEAPTDPLGLSAQERASTLVIGSVSHNFRKHLKNMQPLADYLADQLSDQGIEQGKVLMARNNEDLINYINAGLVDLVSESPFSATQYLSEAGMEILARRWKGDAREYHSVILVHKDSNLTSLSDLRGKKIAFEDAGSSSGYYLPRADLEAAGLVLQPLANPRDQVAADRVGFTFTREEINTATLVMQNIVQAGAISNLDLLSSKRMPAPYQDALRILHESQSIPRSLMLVRQGLAQERKQRLKDVLLTAHTGSGAEQILEDFQRTSRYEAVDEELLEAMERVRTTLENLSSQDP